MAEERIIEKLAELKIVQDRTSSDIREVVQLLREQNGRIRKNEIAVGRLNAISSVIFLGLSGFFTWLFGFKQ